MTRKEAGRLGGLRTYQKYGRDHMSKIGKLGADSTWKRYRLVPVGTSQWALISRDTDDVKSVW